jgi:hypothetical protein
MAIRLVDARWGEELQDTLRADASTLRIVSPFIKSGAIDRLLALRPTRIQVITRFSMADFDEGVSDIRALQALLDAGASVRGIRNLHAKLYLFGASRAIVTSAILTAAALDRNHEFGMVADDAEVIAACHSYFADLWQRGGADLARRQLDAWDQTVTRRRAAGGRPNRENGLPDFGAVAGLTPSPASLPTVVADARQAFVKFLGEGDNRAPLSFATIEEVKRAGCHWAVAYPAAKRALGPG